MPDTPFDDELSEVEEAQLAAFLEDAAIWEEPSMEDENKIVAAILAEAGTEAVASTAPLPTQTPVREAETQLQEQPANVIPISRATRWLAPVAAGVAAAAIVLAGFAFVISNRSPEGVFLALEGTDNAPGASAEAVLADLDAGTRIVLNVSGLPPAEAGTYYEAWMRKDAEVGVSAGTFHLRGGDDEIELWSGVEAADYPLITVTLQDEAQSESSGVVVLKGLFGE